MAVFHLHNQKLKPLYFTPVQHLSIHCVHTFICSLRLTLRRTFCPDDCKIKQQTPRQNPTNPNSATISIHSVHPSTCSRSPLSNRCVRLSRALHRLRKKRAAIHGASHAFCKPEQSARQPPTVFYPPPAKSTPTPILGAFGAAESYIMGITRTCPMCTAGRPPSLAG